MNGPTMETLARRLDRVERENRRLKRVGVAALAVITTLVLMGQSFPGIRTVKADQFVLTDATGEERGIMAIDDTGQPFLDFFDAEQKLRVSLGITGNEAALGFFDPHGKKRMLAGVPQNGPALILMDENEKPSIGLSTFEKGPSIRIFDPKGHGRISLALPSNAAPLFSLADADGHQQVSLLTLGFGVSGLTFYHANQKEAITVATTSGGLRFVMRDVDGKVIWGAP